MMYQTSPAPAYPEFSAIDALLKRAEQMVMLIDRATPKDGAIELARVLEAWRKGRKLVPNFVYQPVPELGELRAELGHTPPHERDQARGIAGVVGSVQRFFGLGHRESGVAARQRR